MREWEGMSKRREGKGMKEKDEEERESKEGDSGRER